VRFAPLVLGFLGLWLAIDSFVLSRLFSALAGPIPWRAMARWRAATYPFFAISFHLGSAALVATLHARTGAPWTRLAGGMLVHYLCDLAALSSLAFAASLAVDAPFMSYVRPVLAGIAVALVLVALAGRAGRGLLRGRPVVEALADLSLADLGRVVAGRWAWYASVTGFVWLTLPCFGLAIPAAELAARMPITLALAALPISPGGLGTTQAAMLALLSPFAPAPELLAYSLAYTGVFFLRVPIGLGLWLPARGATPTGEPAR
jgi:hypothetical protein